MGRAMIGDYRTDALHQALRENPVDDQTLIGLLVLALAGQNVSVQSPQSSSRFGERCRVAGHVITGGVLTRDVSTLRTAAREMLQNVLSCRTGMTSSGPLARVVGDAIGADQFLPNMATDDFLKCLSKGAMERAASAENVLPRNTGRATREALIAHVGQGTYVLPAARFALTTEEVAKLEARAADNFAGPDSDEDPEDLPDGLDDDGGWEENGEPISTAA
jgi:ParB family chromosome partitioning protein